ncbi:hypothetical protein KY343_02405 [Candidatus Woesearchaeota archaeon]|nr:hypothetical protein [Candidatus Woesearchaeota archaeon]
MANRKTEVERIKHTPEYAAAREALGKVYWENKIGLRDLLFLGGQFLINMGDEPGKLEALRGRVAALRAKYQELKEEARRYVLQNETQNMHISG